MNARDLDGKAIVVTGASRGIGKGLAIGLADLGARIVCAARTVQGAASELPGNIDATVEEIRGAGGTAVAVRCDIGEPRDIEHLVERTVTEYGQLDALINNAMTPTRATLEESTVELWDDSMRINVRSLYLLTRAVTPHMRARCAGSIVNISSHAAGHEVSAFMPPGYVIYSVAKAALERFSSAAAVELTPLGITINALRPGAVKTEHTALEYGPDHDWTGWATPASVVPPVAFLAAATDPELTGRVLDVAGFGKSWGA